MALYSASKRSDTPESSSEDLQTGILARYLGETGTSLQKLHTSDPSTATSESHRATESSGIQHGYHDAGHQTDPTSMPSQVGDDKEFPSDKSEYGSSNDRLPACDSRTNSDPIEDLRKTPSAEVLGGIGGGMGSHFPYESELEGFQIPVNEEEGQAIEDRVAHTTAELQEALDNGAQQINKHGSPYQVSAKPQPPTDLTERDENVGLNEHQEGPEDLQPAGPGQLRPSSVERATRMRFWCCRLPSWR